MDVLNLMSLLSYFLFDSSFISTKFLALNLFLIFHYYIIILSFSSFNFRSSIVLYLSSGDIYLSLSISSSFVSELFFGEVFEAFVILSATLFSIKSPVAFAVFFESLSLRQF